MNLYTKPEQLTIDLGNSYNIMEIDGDLIILKDSVVRIKRLDTIEIVCK